MNLQKPAKGAFLIERRQRRLNRVAAEQAVMQAALKRDGRKCRNPRCGFKKSLNLPVDPCHAFKHRGMGGDPSGERTAETRQIISLCRGCHGLLDAGDLEIDPMTREWCDDRCAWYVKDKETGRMVHLATERYIGESTVRSQR